MRRIVYMYMYVQMNVGPGRWLRSIEKIPSIPEGDLCMRKDNIKTDLPIHSTNNGRSVFREFCPGHD